MESGYQIDIRNTAYFPHVYDGENGALPVCSRIWLAAA